MNIFQQIYDLCQPLLESGDYDSAIMRISDLAFSKIKSQSTAKVKTLSDWEDSAKDWEDFFGNEPCEVDESAYLHIMESGCGYSLGKYCQSPQANGKKDDIYTFHTFYTTDDGRCFYLGVLPSFQGYNY